MRTEQAEVLVIGAGPTGLFAAAELARHGVCARIIDLCPEPHTQTRAAGVQPAALEALARAGCLEAFLEEGQRVRGMKVWTDAGEVAFVSRPKPPQTPFPFTCVIPQWRTEQILNAHLEGFGVKVERGVKAVEILPGEEHVTVRCQSGDGSEFIVEAAYLIGAGGAHSPVRYALHQHLEGITYPRFFLAADAVTDLPRGEELLNMFFSKEGLLMVGDLPQGRNVLIIDLPDDHKLEHPGPEDLRAAVARHLSVPMALDDIRWVSCYKTHRRMSPKFREGRCFLAGDAAHLCSPFGGEGMNSGLLDGASLAWQLAAVLRRGGRPCVLDAYEPERRQAAGQVLESSDAISKFYYALVDMVCAGKPLEPLPPNPNWHGTSSHMLDVKLGPSPLLKIQDMENRPIRPGTRFPEQVKLKGCLHHLLVFGQPLPEAPLLERWRHVLQTEKGETLCTAQDAGLTGESGVVVVRPDGYIGFICELEISRALAAVDSWLSGIF